MKRTRLYVTIAVFFPCFVLLGGENASAVLVVCGVTDGGAGDLNPAAGIVGIANCALGAGGSFTGTGTETVTPTFDRIIIQGTFTGAYTGLVASNDYPATFVGEGLLTVILSGVLDNQPGFVGPAVGGEFVQAAAQATSFTGNPSTSPLISFLAGTPLPKGFSGAHSVDADYLGAGTLLGFINYNAAAGEQFVLGSGSGEFDASVPEPGSLMLLGSGVLALICNALMGRSKLFHRKRHGLTLS